MSYRIAMLRVFFRIGQTRIGRWIAGWMIENFSGLLLVDRLFETPRLLAFRHPNPSYPIHVLIVPKKGIHSLLDLDVGDEYVRLFFADLVDCVRKLVEVMDLETAGYRLIVNGGDYQKIPQLHFHLVSG